MSGQTHRQSPTTLTPTAACGANSGTKPTVKRPTFTMGQIVQQFGLSYQAQYHPNPRILKVLTNIANCRTPALGGHLVKCLACGYEKVICNSCGDSNCPSCQNIKKELWIDKMVHHLLPVRHFHLIFTLPHQLKDLFFYNQKKLYSLLFRSAWQTVNEVTGQGHSGMVATLHTWGSNLAYHPHLHCIVPKGTLLGGQWVENVPTNARFFVKSEVLRNTFKDYFMKGLLRLIEEDILYVDGLSINIFTLPKLRQIYQQCQRKKWTVRIETPILGVQQIIQYLGRYIKRVAISNSRILEMSETTVTFQHKEYNKQIPGQPAPKTSRTIEGEKFLQQFAQHILPRYFQRVRYFGLYAWTNKSKKQTAFAVITQQPMTVYQVPSKRQLLQKMLGTDPDVCPDCAAFATLTNTPLVEDLTQCFRFSKMGVNSSAYLKPKCSYHSVGVVFGS